MIAEATELVTPVTVVTVPIFPEIGIGLEPEYWIPVESTIEAATDAFDSETDQFAPET